MSLEMTASALFHQLTSSQPQSTSIFWLVSNEVCAGHSFKWSGKHQLQTSENLQGRDIVTPLALN